MTSGAKKTTAKRAPAKRVSSKPDIRSTMRSMQPSERTTVEQRRAALLATIDEAISLMNDPESSSSARATCIKEIRTIIGQLDRMDADAPSVASAWGLGISMDPE